jgi:XTP/dITP diphosphohydrolase
MHQLLLATRNSHKTREFAEILGNGFDVHDLADVAELPVAEETGLTFEANAILKAVETSKQFPELVVADDSGLEVDALQGAPGIYSARYAGEHATDAANVAKLLAELTRLAPAPGLRNLRGCYRRNNRWCVSGISRIWVRSRLPAAGIQTDIR